MDVLDISDLAKHSLPALEYFSLQCPELNIFDSQLDIKKKKNENKTEEEEEESNLFPPLRIRFTPQVTMHDSSKGLKSTEKILSVWPGACA